MPGEQFWRRSAWAEGVGREEGGAKRRDEIRKGNDEHSRPKWGNFFHTDPESFIHHGSPSEV